MQLLAVSNWRHVAARTWTVALTCRGTAVPVVHRLAPSVAVHDAPCPSGVVSVKKQPHRIGRRLHRADSCCKSWLSVRLDVACVAAFSALLAQVRSANLRFHRFLHCTGADRLWLHLLQCTANPATLYSPILYRTRRRSAPCNDCCCISRAQH